MAALLIDAVLVIVFCIIGRLSHAEEILADPVGTLATIWPFLVGLAIGHIAAAIVRLRADRMPAGTVVWLITVAAGLALRALSGQGVAVPFVVVATLTLALFLLGWRGVAALRRRSAGRLELHDEPTVVAARRVDEE